MTLYSAPLGCWPLRLRFCSDPANPLARIGPNEARWGKGAYLCGGCYGRLSGWLQIRGPAAVSYLRYPHLPQCDRHLSLKPSHLMPSMALLHPTATH
jgi:hypothetical protein